MSRLVRIALIVVLVLVLVALRSFADQLFYDPLAAFFRGEYQGKSLPEMSSAKLLLHTFLRFLITALISLAIVLLWFQNRSKILLTGVILTAVFVVLFPIFWFLTTAQDPSMEVLFYVRRFLIQPLVLLLLIPAFYYQNRAAKP